MSLSFRRGNRTQRDDDTAATIAELKQGQDKLVELVQSLHGELRELKAQQGQVVTMAARSLWAQRDQEAAARTSPQGRQFMAAAPWEVGFGTAPPPAARPALKKKPPRRLPSKGSGYQHLEEELNSTPEAGSSAKAGMSPGFTGEYAEVTRDAGRRFNSGSGRGVLPASHLLVSTGNSDPAKAFFKIGGFVLLGYGIYGSHPAPFRLNTYDESEAGDNWDWHFIDSMYFTMATLTTVGYGDMPTLPQHMRLITIVFGLVGVLVIAGQIGVVVDYLAEGARKVFIEKQKLLVGEAKRVAASLNTRSTASSPGPDADNKGGSGGCLSRLGAGMRRLRLAAGVSDKVAKYYYEATMAANPCFAVVALCLMLGEWENFEAGCDSELTGLQYNGTGKEGCWTLIDSVYFAVITLTTIGYGDVTPSSEKGRLFCALLMPFAVFSLSMVMSSLHNMQEAEKMGADKTLRERLGDLKEVIAADDNGTVDPSEYVLFNLKKMGKVDQDTVDLLKQQFLALDVDGSGELDADDIEMLTDAVDALDARGALGRLKA